MARSERIARSVLVESAARAALAQASNGSRSSRPALGADAGLRVSTGIVTPPGPGNAARRSTRDNDSYRESGAEDSTLDSDSYRPQSGARAPPNWASPGGVGAGSAAWRPAGEEGECHGEDGTGCWRRRLLLRRSPCIRRCGASGGPWRRWRGGAGVAGERWRVRIGSRTAHRVRTPGAHTGCAHRVRTPGAHTGCAHRVRTPYAAREPARPEPFLRRWGFSRGSGRRHRLAAPGARERKGR